MFEAVGQEVMYKANIALTPPNTRYMKENDKVLSGIGYFKDLYLDRDFFRKNPSNDQFSDHLRKDSLFDNKLSNYFRKDTGKKDLGYAIAQSVLYRAATNPSPN
ncbi:MAG: hypothetical protein KAT77_03245 [Nanoarchaeota archaeon]|nr:hypothetical protein [Nanoarchaeota archaeon]